VAVVLMTGALLEMSLPLAPRRPASWRGVGRARPLRTEAVTIPNGQVPPLVVQVPLKGDRCGDSPLPATPYPLPTLLLREPGRLQSGFRRALETGDGGQEAGDRGQETGSSSRQWQ